MMNKNNFSVVVFLLFTFAVKAQTNFFIGLGAAKIRLTEVQSKNNFSPVLTTGIQRNKMIFSVDCRFYENNKAEVPKRLAEINNFFQMSSFQVNTMLGYTFLDKNRFQMSAHAGYAFGKRSLNTIDTYELNNNQEVIALKAQKIASTENGAIAQLNASFHLFKGLSIFGFTDYTIFKGKVENVKTNNRNDVVGFGAGLKYKI